MTEDTKRTFSAAQHVTRLLLCACCASYATAASQFMSRRHTKQVRTKHGNCHYPLNNQLTKQNYAPGMMQVGCPSAMPIFKRGPRNTSRPLASHVLLNALCCSRSSG